MRRIAVRGIILHQNNLLAVKLKNYGDAIAGDYWCLPGGTVEEGEDILTALHREMIEETSISPIIGNMLYINHFLHNKKEHVELFFHIKNTDDYLNIDLSAASHAEQEIAQIKFINPSIEYVLPKFLSTEDVAEHERSNSPTVYYSYLD